MRVGVVLADQRGLEGDVCAHFGQCKFFLLADIDKERKKVVSTRIVPNTASHGGGGCTAVNEIMQYDVTHVIAGGMGMGAQQKFAQAGIRVFGHAGSVKAALDDFLSNTLSGLDACKHHGHGSNC